LVAEENPAHRLHEALAVPVDVHHGRKLVGEDRGQRRLVGRPVLADAEQPLHLVPAARHRVEIAHARQCSPPVMSWHGPRCPRLAAIIALLGGKIRPEPLYPLKRRGAGTGATVKQAAQLQ
jgi:hypothetical protein